MKIVLLSGGKGSRLWPISTTEIPKQFIKLLSNSSNMLSQTYDAISKMTNKENIYVASIKEYITNIKNSIKDFANLIIEPDCIGTFGAVLNIAMYFKEKNIGDDIIAVVPTDHHVDDNFYDCLVDSEELLKNSDSSICLVGIKPKFVSEHYGYITYENNRVLEFEEKPSIKKAEKLIDNGSLWNSGIIVFKINEIINLAKEYLEFDNYDEFLKKYHQLPHNSFDREVLEKKDNILITKSDSCWNDIGTWEVLAPMISEPDKFNTIIINFEDKKIENVGIRDAIIINSANGLKLISKINNED